MKLRIAMKPSLSALLLFAATAALAQPAPDCEWNDCSGPQVGPGPCTPGWVCPVVPPAPPALPVAPMEVCYGDDVCKPVRYRHDGGFMIAETVTPNGYRVMGWSGPCAGPLVTCPDIARQAWADLEINALRINRGLRHSEFD